MIGKFHKQEDISDLHSLTCFNSSATAAIVPTATSYLYSAGSTTASTSPVVSLGEPLYFTSSASSATPVVSLGEPLYFTSSASSATPTVSLGAPLYFTSTYASGGVTATTTGRAQYTGPAVGSGAAVKPAMGLLALGAIALL